MFTCDICKKQFKCESKLREHSARKTPCIKKKYNCELCNINFKYESEYVKHTSTKKHNNNVLSSTGDNNINIQNNGDNNLQQIIQLTLNTHTFINSNVSLVANLSVELVFGIYKNIINGKYLTDYQKAEQLFNEAVLFILDTLNFNIANEENHNLKILLMFPKVSKTVYEYLILEINKETNRLVWNSISYEQLLSEIFNLLNNINLKHIERHNNIIGEKNVIFTNFIHFLRANLLDNEEYKLETKPSIERVLCDLYIKFNADQNKGEREIKLNIGDKVDEYKKYREDECRLSNGYTPNIINSLIN